MTELPVTVLLRERHNPKLGRPRSERYKGEHRAGWASVGLRLPVEVKKRLEEMAEQNGRSQTEELNSIVIAALAKDVAIKTSESDARIKAANDLTQVLRAMMARLDAIEDKLNNK